MSDAIDQERLMKVIAEADEKKRKKVMPGSSASGGSSGVPPKYRTCIPHLGVSCADYNNSRIGTIARRSNSRKNIVAAATVQPCSYSATAAGCHQAVTVVSCQQFSMLQLREDGALCS
jgi:hypothetical protein